MIVTVVIVVIVEMTELAMVGMERWWCSEEWLHT